MRESSRRNRVWFDPRLSIGVGLVIVSVIGVVTVVSAADATTAVFAATAPLGIGDRISRSDLAAVQVRLGGAGELYLTPDAIPDEGLVVTRSIARGELIPTSAVGTQAGADLTNVVIDVNGALAASIGPGSIVDIWSARETTGGQLRPPTVIVDSASVVRIVPDSGFMANDRSVPVELMVPRDAVAAVLEAVANSDALSIVPVSTALGR